MIKTTLTFIIRQDGLRKKEIESQTFDGCTNWAGLIILTKMGIQKNQEEIPKKMLAHQLGGAGNFDKVGAQQSSADTNWQYIVNFFGNTNECSKDNFHLFLIVTEIKIIQSQYPVYHRLMMIDWKSWSHCLQASKIFTQFLGKGSQAFLFWSETKIWEIFVHIHDVSSIYKK